MALAFRGVVGRLLVIRPGLVGRPEQSQRKTLWGLDGHHRATVDRLHHTIPVHSLQGVGGSQCGDNDPTGSGFAPNPLDERVASERANRIVHEYRAVTRQDL